PVSKIPYFTDGSLKAGQDAASGFIGADVRDLCKERGILIEKRKGGKSAFGVTLRGMSEMGPNGFRIELYEESLASMAETCGFEYAQAEDAHLAHEFFHYLEYSSVPVPQMLGKVQTFKLLGLKREACINRASEVGAHSFAKALLGLQVLPNFFDYQYLIGSGKMTQEAFDGKIREMEKLLQEGDAEAKSEAKI
ncbi:MAG: hypothetical protein LBT59_01460, partial [Clostridiales bacterium]|nr:hypothetical protein [Clostridiales bacterium]